MQEEQSNLKVLCDTIDPEDSGDEGSETQYEIGMLYSDMYDLSEIPTYFGTPDFMSIYLSSIDSIKIQYIKNQATLCMKLLDKIYEIYEYDFPETPTLNSQSDLNRVYDLVEFLEFDNEQFLINVWKSFNIKNLVKLDLDIFFYGNKDNINKLLEQITNNSLLYDKNSLINKFLNSCYKEALTKIFIKMTRRFKVEITSKLLEG